MKNSPEKANRKIQKGIKDVSLSNSKIIGSDVRHGTKMGRKGYKMERLCNVN